MTEYKTISFSEAKNELQKLFPCFVEDPTRKLTRFWTGSVFNTNRGISQELIEQFGDFATIWEGNTGTVNTNARWDYLERYYFKNEADAVFFKLKYM